MRLYPFFLLFGFLWISCTDTNPNKDTQVTTEHQNIGKGIIDRDSIHHLKKVYVPVYSNIYQRSRNERVPLTSTLSIHNTSDTDTLFFKRIAYFDTKGDLVRNYLDETVYMNTFETLEYVVDENDDSGGSGANFYIEWYGEETLNPIFQGVMVGGFGNNSFSFVTEGVAVVKDRK